MKLAYGRAIEIELTRQKPPVKAALHAAVRKEMLALLAGDRVSLWHSSARRAAYERYRTLPPYPAVVIHGRFDPFQRAADPQQRSDLFGAGRPSPCVRGRDHHGPVGAPGVTVGRVRVIAAAADGDQL